MAEYCTGLTAAELGALWSQYMNDNMAKYILQYFSYITEDEQIGTVIDTARKISSEQNDVVAQLYGKYKIPLPHGFSEADVNVKAPRLYSDRFVLHYIKQMAKIGIQGYGLAVSMATTPSVKSYFSRSLASSVHLDQQCTEVMKTKGNEMKSPSIPIQEEAELNKTQGLLGSLFGKKRTLQAIESSHLYLNTATNMLGKALLTGFSQVAGLAEIKKYCLRGIEISSKHINLFSSLLTADNIPLPMSWDADVTTSTEAPFSEKLIVSHIMTLNATGISSYGLGMSISGRVDLTASYARLMAEIMAYMEDGGNLMVEKQWLEMPPQAVDRAELALSR